MERSEVIAGSHPHPATQFSIPAKQFAEECLFCTPGVETWKLHYACVCACVNVCVCVVSWSFSTNYSRQLLCGIIFIPQCSQTGHSPTEKDLEDLNSEGEALKQTFPFHTHTHTDAHTLQTAFTFFKVLYLRKPPLFY